MGVGGEGRKEGRKETGRESTKADAQKPGEHIGNKAAPLTSFRTDQQQQQSPTDSEPGTPPQAFERVVGGSVGVRVMGLVLSVLWGGDGRVLWVTCMFWFGGVWRRGVNMNVRAGYYLLDAWRNIGSELVLAAWV